MRTGCILLLTTIDSFILFSLFQQEKQGQQASQRERKGQLLEQQDIFLASGKLDNSQLTKLKLKTADLTSAWDTVGCDGGCLNRWWPSPPTMQRVVARCLGECLGML